MNNDKIREGVADWLGVRRGVLSRIRHAVNVVLSHTNDLLEAIDDRLKRAGAGEGQVAVGVDCLGFGLKVLRQLGDLFDVGYHLVGCDGPLLILNGGTRDSARKSKGGEELGEVHDAGSAAVALVLRL